MKMMKMIYPLALAAAVTFAGAGCKHTPPRTTALPGPSAPPPGPGASGGVPINEPSQPPQLPSGQPINPEPAVNVTPTPPPSFQNTNEFATSEFDLSKYDADREALAANTVHFAFDQAVIKDSEESNVQAVAAYLASHPKDNLMIEGNCDERGTEEYNRSLGERRALALREDLAKQNVDPKRVRTISYGKDKPVDAGHDEAAFAKNRRGDFVVYHPKAGGV